MSIFVKRHSIRYSTIFYYEPISFLLYINDLYRFASDGAYFVVYLDDILVIISNCSDMQYDCNVVHTNLDKFVIELGLNLYLEKTKYIAFYNHQSSCNFPLLVSMLGKQTRQRGKYLKFLGFHVN